MSEKEPMGRKRQGNQTTTCRMPPHLQKAKMRVLLMLCLISFLHLHLRRACGYRTCQKSELEALLSNWGFGGHLSNYLILEGEFLLEDYPAGSLNFLWIQRVYRDVSRKCLSPLWWWTLEQLYFSPALMLSLGAPSYLHSGAWRKRKERHRELLLTTGCTLT